MAAGAHRRLRPRRRRPPALQPLRPVPPRAVEIRRVPAVLERQLNHAAEHRRPQRPRRVLGPRGCGAAVADGVVRVEGDGDADVELREERVLALETVPTWRQSRTQWFPAKAMTSERTFCNVACVIVCMHTHERQTWWIGADVVTATELEGCQHGGSKGPRASSPRARSTPSAAGTCR